MNGHNEGQLHIYLTEQIVTGVGVQWRNRALWAQPSSDAWGSIGAPDIIRYDDVPPKCRYLIEQVVLCQIGNWIVCRVAIGGNTLHKKVSELHELLRPIIVAVL